MFFKLGQVSHHGSNWFLLIALFLFVIVRQMTWSLVNPLFQGPDEVVHIQMVAQMDKNGLAFYRLSKPVTWRDFEATYDFNEDWYHQRGIIWHLDRKPLYVEGSRWGVDEKTNLHHSNFDRIDAAKYFHMQSYEYPPLYYWLTGKAVGLFRSLGATLVAYQYGMRLVQAAFYIGFCLVAFCLANEVIQEPFSLFWTVSCILFHPMFIFMGSVVNNDNGLLPFSLILILGAVRLLKRPDHLASIWVMAIASVCLTLVKATGFLLVLVAYPTVGILLVLEKRVWIMLRLAPGFIAASALFLWLPSWIGQYGLYGGEPGRLTVSRYLEIIFGYLGWNMIGNLLGQFAWFEIDFPTPVYVVFICLLVLSLLISVHHLVRAATRGNWDINLRLFLFLFLTLIVAVLVTFAYQYAVAERYGLVIQGRYLLYALPLLYLCPGMIMAQAISYTRRRGVIFASYLLATSILLCLISLSVMGLYLIVERFFWDPGISSTDLIARAMQYKPAVLKNDLGFAVLSGSYVAGHLGFLAYFIWFSRHWLRQVRRNSSVA